MNDVFCAVSASSAFGDGVSSIWKSPFGMLIYLRRRYWLEDIRWMGPLPPLQRLLSPPRREKASAGEARSAARTRPTTKTPPSRPPPLRSVSPPATLCLGDGRRWLSKTPFVAALAYSLAASSSLAGWRGGDSEISLKGSRLPPDDSDERTEKREEDDDGGGGGGGGGGDERGLFFSSLSLFFARGETHKGPLSTIPPLFESEGQLRFC